MEAIVDQESLGDQQGGPLVSVDEGMISSHPESVSRCKIGSIRFAISSEILRAGQSAFKKPAITDALPAAVHPDLFIVDTAPSADAVSMNLPIRTSLLGGSSRGLGLRG